MTEIERLRGENARLRSALEHYADEGNWEKKDGQQWKYAPEGRRASYIRGWEVAREALSGEGED